MLLNRPRLARGVRVVTRQSAPFGLQLVPLRVLSVSEVRRIMDRLPDTDGPIVTSALNAIEEESFKGFGFVERESLHLLRHDLSVSATEEPKREFEERRLERSAELFRAYATIRSAKRRDLDEVLDIDRSCFDPFWTFDRNALSAARKATATSRYQLAVVDGAVAGYAITGLAGVTSYLQRLAVHPRHRGNQVGSQLVSDAIEWASNHGSVMMMVNTQVSNVGALDFYRAVGFELSRDQLKVLEWHG